MVSPARFGVEVVSTNHLTNPRSGDFLEIFPLTIAIKEDFDLLLTESVIILS